MKYMVLDITTIEGTSVLAVAPTLRTAALFGKIQQAAGKKVVAPPVEGRGFSVLERTPLQYLYWNMCGEVPPEDYSLLIRQCLEKIETLPVLGTPLQELEAEVARLYPGVAPTSEKREPIHSEAGQPERPKATSTTGRVWELADAAFSKHYEPSSTMANVDWKSLRGEIMTSCEASGINTATASTQYSKWKRAKEGGST